MLIRLGYDIEFNIPQPVAVVALLNVHPSRAPDLLEPDELNIEPAARKENYFDRFGKRKRPLIELSSFFQRLEVSCRVIMNPQFVRGWLLIFQ